MDDGRKTAPLPDDDLGATEDPHDVVQRTLDFVSGRASRIRKGDLLTALMSHLADSLNVPYAFCGLIAADDPDTVETITFISDGEVSENFSYSLIGAPCENVVGQSVCCFDRNVQKLFPEDRALITMGIESYAGMPLWRADGSPLGLIAVLDTRPWQHSALIIDLLRIVAAPVGLEAERRLYEGRLRAEEQRLRDYAEASSDWFWETGPDHRFTYFSDRVEEVVGVPPSFHIGKTRADLAGEDAKSEKWRRHLQDLREHRAFRDFRYVRKGPGGRLEYISTSGKPIFDRDGNFAGYVGVGTDLTRQMEAESRARLAHERLAAAVESLSEIFALWDSEDKLVICNNKFREFNEAILDQVEPGMTYEEHLRAGLEKGLYPEAAGHKEAWFKERLARHHNPTEPFEVARQDNQWILVNEQRLTDGSTVTMASDISGLKAAEKSLRESQERFKDFADSSADWFWEQDENLRFTNVTEENVEITGMPTQDHYGKTRRETGIQGVTEEQWDAHEKDLQARRPFQDFRFSRIRPDGKRVYLSVRGKPIYGEDGRFLGYRGTGQDITALVMAEKNLEAERDRADAANAAKTEFLATMSHDLRTPLTAIIGFAEFMKQGIHGPLGDSRYDEYLDRVHQNSQRLLLLINDILDLSRIERGEYKFSEDWIDMADEIDSSRRRCVPQVVNDASEKIFVDVVERAPRLFGDSRAISQILDNLISNALKYSDEKVEITVQWSIGTEGRGLLSVEDTGHGIAEDQLEAVMLPFVRGVDGAGDINQRAGTSEGTGLGLYIISKLAGLHQAEVSIESVEMKGTKVTVIFPAGRMGPAD